MTTSLKDAVEKSFLTVHEGRSTDDVVIEPVLNKAFLSECQKLAPNASDFDANWQLLNLRKASSLGKVTTDVHRFSHGDYQHASQIAARQLEDRFQLTVDRILCDPAKRDEFDAIASSVAADVPVYQLRKAALGLRKARKLRPELIKRIADWGVEILSFEAKQLTEDGDLIPRKPGIYLFRDKSGYLYIGEASSLRSRVSKHLDHSDRKALARHFWDTGITEVVVELHAFDAHSDARKTGPRRAYESELIEKRNPRFNIRP
ncbi:hypothetical protein K227x_58390 [Rubripirellula lacrimiformis]|uniref:GIY-YIG domain-containing protein n=1 Tax=Rubripirellula lacrimiformis TaxID=1930273 RepID=A0A517NJV5_9BACT|nr:GIY-YIG nuclease family protein [Rubripirellula lacrimiformis]QDT07412.1 hypothetical protein K227x_58390 [Rubripirellula lacrimiformis]